MTAVEIVSRVIDALNQSAIPYMLVGSFSSNLYGVPRSTRDADFVLQLESTPINTLVSLLGPDYRLDPQMSFETVTATTRYKLHHTATAFTIELFLLSPDPHDQLRFARRLQTVFNARHVFVPTPEDVIITKLRWSKQGQRAKDLDDVRNVLAIQLPNLDMPYIRSWCAQHNTVGLLDRLLQSSV